MTGEVPEATDTRITTMLYEVGKLDREHDLPPRSDDPEYLEGWRDENRLQAELANPWPEWTC